MFEIMITYPNGQTEKTFIRACNTEEAKKFQSMPCDELLYFYLLRNTPLKAYDEGLPDEEQKVLKHFGVKYWEPGKEEVTFGGKVYKVVMSYEI